ncbi:thrombopoietin isoform X1 [Denticeps clupeoides]|uniref:thrombopoietin isoform X1 n=1 Tax=Denticeps clupeoides TaxID=299321 RepID=UPI0010A558ED|nr:thrombopoietin isoform X1 [Denticeps clupeoides]
MAVSNLLLPVLLLASALWHGQTRPADFVCDGDTRVKMNQVKELEAMVAECSSVNPLPSQIHLPRTRINVAAWKRKSVHEKRGEILLSLETLVQDVKAARKLVESGCGSSMLERLEHSAKNYLHIAEPGNVDSPSQNKQTQDIGQVLKYFGQLLKGRLEWLIGDLKDSCRREEQGFSS